jgi:hypothetical protein
VLCCCLLEALHQPPPIPMAYRRKQGAADDHRSSYPQARTPLPPLASLLCPVCLLVRFLLGYPTVSWISDSKSAATESKSQVRSSSDLPFILRCLDRTRTELEPKENCFTKVPLLTSAHSSTLPVGIS